MGDPGAYISKTTWARDFKFAGALVQRLYLVLVVIAKFFSVDYALVDDHIIHTLFLVHVL